MARALEDASEVVRASAASLIPAFVAMRSQAKVVSAAVSALDVLKGKAHPFHVLCRDGIYFAGI